MRSLLVFLLAVELSFAPQAANAQASRTSGNIGSGQESADTHRGVIPDDFRTAADGDDDAPSIQRAVNALCKGAGTKLDWLSRHYLIASAIVQNCPLMWEGQGWQEAPSTIATARGTWLDIKGTGFTPVTIRGTTSKGSEIRNIAVDQPGQPASTTSGTWEPAPYPYVFDVEDVGGYVGFHHIFMDGVTNGIKSFNGGRTIIDGLWGQFFNNDVFFDQETDVSRIYDMHSWPYWSDKSPVIDYQQRYHEAIVLGRADSPFLDRLFIFAASSGIKIQTGVVGSTATGVEVGMISCDSVVSCVRVEGLGSDIFISEMRQFGQLGLSSAVPYPGSTALLIEGSGLFRIGLLSAQMIDVSPIIARNTSACSTVLVSQMDVDFSRSKEHTVNLLHAARCSSPGSPTTRIVFGLPPVVRYAPGQTVLNSIVGTVSWPDQVLR